MPDELKQSKETPTYLGHRSRLRRRFLVDDGFSMPDYEMLELLLMMSIPRRDVKQTAKLLIEKFGNINGVINAPVSELIKISGISENTATLIKLVEVCRLRSAGRKLNSPEDIVFDGFTDFVYYCRQKTANETNEKYFAFYFDAANKFLGESEVGKVNNGSFETDMGKMMQDAIHKNATCIILAHYHLSGDVEPSKEEMLSTEKICYLLYKMNIKLEDYLIMTPNKIFGFKNAGIMPSAEINKLFGRQKKL